MVAADFVAVSGDRFAGVDVEPRHASGHGDAAMASLGAMGVNLAAILYLFQSFLDASRQRAQGNGQDGIVERVQPHVAQRRIAGGRPRAGQPAHVDDQADAEIAQGLEVPAAGAGPDKQAIGDG